MSFAFYSPVTFDHTQIPSDQTDFSVLIGVTDARFKTVGNGGHVENASGFDVRPYSDSALTSPLSYELTSFDGSTGDLTMFVKSDISSSVDTTIYLGYGDPSLTTDGSTTAAWDSNYATVWHMNDDAATPTIRDSTTTGDDATNNANTSTRTATGQIGKALTYNGSTDGSAAAVDLSVASVVTLSFWVNWTTNADNDDLAFEFTSNYNSDDAFIADWNSSSGAFDLGMHDTGGGGYWTDSLARPSAGSWHLIHLVYNRGSFGLVPPSNTAYVDGAIQTLTPITHNGPFFVNHTFANSNLNFMSRDTSVLNAAGTLDEVRLSTVERGADWITTEFNNQSDPNSFETLGAEVPVSGDVTVDLTGVAASPAVGQITVLIGRRSVTDSGRPIKRTAKPKPDELVYVYGETTQCRIGAMRFDVEPSFMYLPPARSAIGNISEVDSDFNLLAAPMPSALVGEVSTNATIGLFPEEIAALLENL